MKKLFCIVLLVGLVVALGGCGGSSSAASERNINIATRAVEIADEFLDASISARDAHDRIGELADIDTTRIGDMDVDTANTVLSSNLLLLHISLSAVAWEDTIENYDTVLENRNSLAERIGMRNR